MSAYLKIFGDVLETLVELSQEEVDDNDAHIEAQERGTVENPFSNMLQNMLSGGGRTRRQRILGNFNHQKFTTLYIIILRCNPSMPKTIMLEYL